MSEIWQQANLSQRNKSWYYQAIFYYNRNTVKLVLGTVGISQRHSERTSRNEERQTVFWACRWARCKRRRAERRRPTERQCTWWRLAPAVRTHVMLTATSHHISYKRLDTDTPTRSYCSLDTLLITLHFSICLSVCLSVCLRCSVCVTQFIVAALWPSCAILASDQMICLDDSLCSSCIKMISIRSCTRTRLSAAISRS